MFKTVWTVRQFRAILAELEGMTCEHFDYAERIMAEFEYLELARHAVERAALLREVQGYQDKVVFSPRRPHQILGNWLQSHTMIEDRPLAQHVLLARAGSSDVALGSESAGGAAPSPESAIRSRADSDDKLASGG